MPAAQSSKIASPNAAIQTVTVVGRLAWLFEDGMLREHAHTERVISDTWKPLLKLLARIVDNRIQLLQSISFGEAAPLREALRQAVSVLKPDTPVISLYESLNFITRFRLLIANTLQTLQQRSEGLTVTLDDWESDLNQRNLIAELHQLTAESVASFENVSESDPRLTCSTHRKSFIHVYGYLTAIGQADSEEFDDACEFYKRQFAATRRTLRWLRPGPEHVSIQRRFEIMQQYEPRLFLSSEPVM